MLDTVNNTSYDKLALRRLIECVKEVRRVSPEMPVQTLHTLLAVAMEPGISMSDLMARTKLGQSSCSRNVALLSENHRLGKPGLNLVVAFEDPKERRRKLVDLTSKGVEVVSVLADTVR